MQLRANQPFANIACSTIDQAGAKAVDLRQGLYLSFTSLKPIQIMYDTMDT
jgi:hypothetical protein